MTTAQIKMELGKALEKINDQSFLEALFTIINTHSDLHAYELDDIEKSILNERRAEYLEGKVKTYSRSEVKRKIQKNTSK